MSWFPRRLIGQSLYPFLWLSLCFFCTSFTFDPIVVTVCSCLGMSTNVHLVYCPFLYAPNHSLFILLSLGLIVPQNVPLIYCPHGLCPNYYSVPCLSISLSLYFSPPLFEMFSWCFIWLCLTQQTEPTTSTTEFQFESDSTPVRFTCHTLCKISFDSIEFEAI